jgi:adenosylhomocysteine nucleosidase
LAAESLVPNDLRLANRMCRILTTDRLISDPIEKKRLGERHQADVVDMESAAVAEVCARAGIPFLAVRAVSDTVETRLSSELVNLLSGGRVSSWKAAAAILRRPRLLGEFLRLARDTRRASQNLATVLVRLLGE